MQDDQTAAKNTPSMPPPPPQSESNNEALSLLIPVGQSGWAIAAGYLGLFSLLLWPLGFVAVLASYKALSRRRTGAGMVRIVTGFVGGSVGICISLLILVAIASS
jgi:hypothetical protein